MYPSFKDEMFIVRAIDLLLRKGLESKQPLHDIKPMFIGQDFLYVKMRMV